MKLTNTVIFSKAKLKTFNKKSKKDNFEELGQTKYYNQNRTPKTSVSLYCQ